MTFSSSQISLCLYSVLISKDKLSRFSLSDVLGSLSLPVKSILVLVYFDSGSKILLPSNLSACSLPFLPSFFLFAPDPSAFLTFTVNLLMAVLTSLSPDPSLFRLILTLFTTLYSWFAATFCVEVSFVFLEKNSELSNPPSRTSPLAYHHVLQWAIDWDNHP